jgi:hypothetical protein
VAKYFFLDWCPAGAMPADCALPAQTETIPRTALDPFLYKSANVGDSAAPAIPHADAVTSIKIVARPDGLYVLQLEIDLGKGFNLSDLDEVAFVAAMVAKAGLGHTHYHHNMPGRGKAAKLKPSQILYVSPVQLAPTGWSTRVKLGRLTNGDLAAARATTDQNPRHDALLELRHRYIRLEDAISFRLRAHRTLQGQRLRGIIGWLSFLAYGLAAGLSLFLFVLPAATEVRPEHYAALIMSSVFVAFGLQFGGRIVTWDVPVIRLLRTAHGFFLSANGVNKVIHQATGVGPLDDFSGVITNLQSRIEGEQHRIGMSQNWMAVTLGAASLVAAVSALNTDKVPGPTAEPAPMEKVEPRTTTEARGDPAPKTVRPTPAPVPAPQIRAPAPAADADAPPPPAETAVPTAPLTPSTALPVSAPPAVPVSAPPPAPPAVAPMESPREAVPEAQR